MHDRKLPSEVLHSPSSCYSSNTRQHLVTVAPPSSTPSPSTTCASAALQYAHASITVSTIFRDPGKRIELSSD
eukprot:3370110-Pyramimonas_sp.AAC.1